MRATIAFLILLATAGPASAQSLPPAPIPNSPAQFQRLAELKTQATAAVDAVLTPGQRQSVRAIALDTQRALRGSFGDPAAGVASIFTQQQLGALAAALRSGSLPTANEDQMAQIATLMSGIVLNAAPVWEAHARQVDAVLTPAQQTKIAALRAATLRRLPHIAFMGMDLAQQLGDGSQLGAIATDPGSFALLLALPDTDALLSVAKRQTRP